MPEVSKSKSDSQTVSTMVQRVQQRAVPWNNPTYTDTVIWSQPSLGQTFSMSKAWRAETNFRLLKASGALLPDRPFSYQEIRRPSLTALISGPTVTTWDYRQRTQYRFTGWTGLPAPAASYVLSPSSLYPRLHEKARGASVNAPVFIAEARQTSKMVHQTAVRLTEAAIMLRRGNLQGFVDRLHVTYRKKVGRREIRRWNRYFAKDQFRSFSKIWLEARYGWVPFYSEVYAYGELLNELQDDRESLATVVSVRAEQVRTASQLFVNCYNAGADGGLAYDIKDTIREELRVTWKFFPTSLDGLGRFGLTNPALVAWELVPFSFVADWFLPIGSYLNQLDLPHRFSHAGGDRKSVV